MKRVVIESPYAALRGWKGGAAESFIRENLDYLNAAIRHSLSCGEAPYASHGFFTWPGRLRDEIPEERKLGIEAGFAWGVCAELVAVYVDRGVSRGMQAGIEKAIFRGTPVEYRWKDDAGGWAVSKTLPDRFASEPGTLG